MPATKKKPAKPAKTPAKKRPSYLRDSLDGYDRENLSRQKKGELIDIARQTQRSAEEGFGITGDG